jgi:hypothetical protein
MGEWNSADIQAWSTVALAVLTAAYVLVTAKLAREPARQHDHAQRRRRRLAMLSLLYEVREVATADSKDMGTVAIKFPTHSWDTMKGDLCEVLGSELIEKLLKVYLDIRKANTRYKQVSCQHVLVDTGIRVWEQCARQAIASAQAVLDEVRAAAGV